ncbi:protein FAR1-RELATED SEQUENCE 5-like [Bidens hawaiensis]|uniref:protein FAR1-RELATED SEQUENCE 5-like n=1 Tax=Bidens hawaiensis TaxID=980011 RepID=UPI0040493B56
MDVLAGYNDDITLTTPSSQVFSIPFDQSTSNNFLNHLVSPTSQGSVSLSHINVLSLYKMIFVPFTGVDHHKKCVTFGAALISSETIDSYKWLLQSFLNCHGQQPKLVLSDQDPSMRQAVVQVSGDVIENTNVRSRIHRLTTSRCESSNATFKVNSTSANTLVQFMLCMESRLDNQRYSQRSSEYKTSYVSFKSTTGEEIERHAFDLYTQAIFNEVIKEIMKGKYCCYVTHTESVDDHVLYSVTHLDKRQDITNVFLVNFDLADNSASCSCMGFTRIGFFCRHVFCVYRIKKVYKIPLKCVSDRWKRDVLPRSVFSISNRFSVDYNPQSVLRFEVLEMVSQCVDMLRVDSKGLNSFAMKIKELKSLFFEKSFRNADAVDDNESVFKEIIGNANEGDDFIENPDAVRTRGCGKVRRVMGDSEKIVVKAGKVARLCRTCGEYVHHGSRICPLNPKNKKKKSLADPESSDNV